MDCRLGVDDEADRRAWGIGGREGESKRGWPEMGHGLLGQLAHGREEGEEEGLGCGFGPKRREGRNEPRYLFLFSNSLFYFLSLICICLNDFKFKFECMSV